MKLIYNLRACIQFPFSPQSFFLYMVCMEELLANPETCWLNTIKIFAYQQLKLNYAFQHLNVIQQTSSGWYFMAHITITGHPI